MARCVVTGGAGYIGSVLCEYLLDAGHSVMVLDNFRHGVPSLSHLVAKGLKIIRGDVRVVSHLKAAIAAADVIIPLAGIVGAQQCDEDPLAAETTNSAALRALTLIKGKEQRVIFPNTNSGYGTSGEALCTEESEMWPISLYGRTKLEAERTVMGAPGSTVFRLATAFGMSPRMRWDLMVNDFTRRAVTDRAIVVFEGQFRRNFIHVRDVARAFCWAIDNSVETAGQVFNLGLSDANLTKLQLAELVSKKTGCAVLEAPTASDPDKRDYFISNEKIERAGFKLAYSLNDGISELVEGARQF